MEHAFGGGTPFSIGLEEELLLVDRHLALAHVADRIVPEIDLPEGRAGHEAFLAEIELRSDPCPSTQAAVRQLAEAGRRRRRRGPR